jgi:dienelactone hydrolase
MDKDKKGEKLVAYELRPAHRTQQHAVIVVRDVSEVTKLRLIAKLIASRY